MFNLVTIPFSLRREKFIVKEFKICFVFMVGSKESMYLANEAVGYALGLPNSCLAYWHDNQRTLFFAPSVIFCMIANANFPDSL